MSDFAIIHMRKNPDATEILRSGFDQMESPIVGQTTVCLTA